MSELQQLAPRTVKESQWGTTTIVATTLLVSAVVALGVSSLSAPAASSSLYVANARVVERAPAAVRLSRGEGVQPARYLPESRTSMDVPAYEVTDAAAEDFGVYSQVPQGTQPSSLNNVWLLGSLAAAFAGLMTFFRHTKKTVSAGLDPLDLSTVSSSNDYIAMAAEASSKAGYLGISAASNKGRKQIIYDTEARAAMMRGVNTVADTVGITLGPRGRNVVMKVEDDVYVINDGVSIARSIVLEDPAENTGAQLIKEVAGRTNDSAGDGTTTSVVLARAMIKTGLKAVAVGRNPMSIKAGIVKARDFVVEELKRRAIPVRDTEDIKNIAAISAGNDIEIGELIAEAVDRVGPDGVLTLEDSNTTDTYVEIKEGMEIDRGFISNEFINNTEKSIVEFYNPAVLICDDKVTEVATLVPILEKILAAGEERGEPIPLVLIAEDVGGEALALLLVNKLRGVLPCVALRAPGFGDLMAPCCQDVAIVCDGEFFAKTRAMSIENAELEDLGTCRKIIVTPTSMTIISDGENKEDIQLRMKQLKQEMEDNPDSVYKTLRLSERIAKLAGGIAIINIGANSEVELEDKKLRCEDAKNATLAAISEGIVPGGGTALLHLSEMLPDFIATLTDEDEIVGATLVMKAMPAPVHTIAKNAGLDGEVIANRIIGKDFNHGYNAMTGEYEDMIKSGVIDPARVTRNVFLNACSITSIMLTTQAVVTGQLEKPTAMDTPL